MSMPSWEHIKVSHSAIGQVVPQHKHGKMAAHKCVNVA
jgi:hypothetical protein